MNSKLLRKQENNNMATRNDITGDSIQSKNNSKKSSFLLKNKGSISDVNKAPVLIETNATETFATFMAEKNVIQ